MRWESLLLFALPASGFVPHGSQFRKQIDAGLSAVDNPKQANKLISENRKANFEYDFDETLEAGEIFVLQYLSSLGLLLTSCRDCSCRIRGEELPIRVRFDIRRHCRDN